MTRADDAAPCRHQFPTELIEATRELLVELDTRSPELLSAVGIPKDEWPIYLRAAVESLRGSWAATTTEKYRFVESVLRHGEREGAFKSWERVGTEGRNDFRVLLPDGTNVSIEAKGCPDGNNTTIWDRPGWADEFVVWLQCPSSFVHQPGKGIWAGVANRLFTKIAAERVVVDAVVFFDGRCGSAMRQCPKDYGVTGLRREATDILAQPGKPDWLPPPCIYLMPRSAPNVANNAQPAGHTTRTLKFAAVLLDLFNVPAATREDYVHDAMVAARSAARGTEIKVTIESRCWPDGVSRVVDGRWKALKRE